MVAQYNAARCGDLPIGDAKGLIYILSCIAAVIRDGDLAARLADLEQRIEAGDVGTRAEPQERPDDAPDDED